MEDERIIDLYWAREEKAIAIQSRNMVPIAGKSHGTS